MNTRDNMVKGTNSQALWKQVVADYRQACVLRREGREIEASKLIDEKLPVSIAAWSKADPRSPADKKTILEAMFESEQTSIETWLFAQHTLASRLSDTLIPALRQHVSDEIRDAMAAPGSLRTRRTSGVSYGRAARVRFDDIPAVIDTLLAQQQADYGARAAYAC